MKTVELRSRLTLVLALAGAAALIAAGPGAVDAQVLPACPGIPGSGGWGSSSSSVPSYPSWCMPYGWCGPHSSYWPMPGPFGNTAISTSRPFMLNMGDNSSVQMPQMIKPPPVEGWVPSAERTADSTPKIQPPRRVATGTVVRRPLMVQIVPEARLADPRLAHGVNRPRASKASP